MSEPIDHAATVAAAARAFSTARRAAQAAGFVEVMLSKEAVEALRDCWGCQGEEHRVGVFVAMQLLARDLGPLLKADQ